MSKLYYIFVPCNRVHDAGTVLKSAITPHDSTSFAQAFAYVGLSYIAGMLRPESVCKQQMHTTIPDFLARRDITRDSEPIKGMSQWCKAYNQPKAASLRSMGSSFDTGSCAWKTANCSGGIITGLRGRRRGLDGRVSLRAVTP